MKLITHVDISPQTIKQAFLKREVLEFILQLDLEYSEVDFTENLIIELIKTLQCDLSEEEWKPYQQLLDSVEKTVNKIL